MHHSVLQMKRPVRRRLKKVVQSNADANYRRRANAVLALANGKSVSETARQVQASRTSVRRWRNRFERSGEEGLVPLQRDSPAGIAHSHHVLPSLY